MTKWQVNFKMAEAKLSYEQFLEAVDAENRAYMQELHDYMLSNGCKVTFEEKKTSLLGSYKYAKKSAINVLQKKQGLVVRIYGENIGEYLDFLNTLPQEMVQAIEGAGKCKRLADNTCNPKCIGYDFTIGSEHFQKCRYNCFEFLVTEESGPYIRAFVENEIKARTAA